jgi:protein tyrosine/serine phosphatase
MNGQKRWVDLDGAVNVRDLGGLAAHGGSITRFGRVLRADNLQDLTEGDIRRLVGELGLRHVIDLRSQAEVRLEGPGPLAARPEVTTHHLSLFAEGGYYTDVDADTGTSTGETAGETTGEPPGNGGGFRADAPPDVRSTALPDARPEVRSDVRRDARPDERYGVQADGEPDDGPARADDVRRALALGPDDELLPWRARQETERSLRSLDFYLGYLRDRPDSIVAALRVMAHREGVSLVHCAAGKDRTGVVVAFALEVAGVTRDAVVADYVQTGERLERILARLRASTTYAADLDGRPADSHRPRAETMEKFLATVDERYGGPLGWLRRHGWTDADRAALVAKLRAP